MPSMTSSINELDEILFRVTADAAVMVQRLTTQIGEGRASVTTVFEPLYAHLLRTSQFLAHI